MMNVLATLCYNDINDINDGDNGKKEIIVAMPIIIVITTIAIIKNIKIKMVVMT